MYVIRTHKSFSWYLIKKQMVWSEMVTTLLSAVSFAVVRRMKHSFFVLNIALGYFNNTTCSKNVQKKNPARFLFQMSIKPSGIAESSLENSPYNN